MAARRAPVTVGGLSRRGGASARKGGDRGVPGLQELERKVVVLGI